MLQDLFDNMYELIDSITFRLRHIPKDMWPIFEVTYDLFKSDAISWLEGQDLQLLRMIGDSSSLHLN